MANRPRPTEAVWEREVAKLEKAVHERDAAQKEAVRADMALRKAIKTAFNNGLSASYISEATGLTISRLYQVKRGVRT